MAAGQKAAGTRRSIMEAAARLCRERPGAELSVAEIAKAAGVYPNLITYHFGSKDSLMVHAAFLGLLSDTKRVEKVGERATTPDAFRRNLARAVLAMPSLPSVSRALAAAVARPGLTPVVDTHLKLLFRMSERYLTQIGASRGWAAQRPLAVEVRTFWSAALGATLLSRAGASGSAADLDLAGILTLGRDSSTS